MNKTGKCLKQYCLHPEYNRNELTGNIYLFRKKCLPYGTMLHLKYDLMNFDIDYITGATSLIRRK